jgi:hypothetical protein
MATKTIFEFLTKYKPLHHPGQSEAHLDTLQILNKSCRQHLGSTSTTHQNHQLGICIMLQCEMSTRHTERERERST